MTGGELAVPANRHDVSYSRFTQPRTSSDFQQSLRPFTQPRCSALSCFYSLLEYDQDSLGCALSVHVMFISIAIFHEKYLDILKFTAILALNIGRHICFVNISGLAACSKSQQFDLYRHPAEPDQTPADVTSVARAKTFFGNNLRNSWLTLRKSAIDQFSQ